ncbi:hypothetical protein BS78_08G007400 [Paspalum vaginatum]|nr:hypothetical protein BS78_08G007400 [Paspalum vaginatum]
MQKEYEELLLDESNYPTWASDIKIASASRGILSTISEPVENGPVITKQMRYTGLMLLRSSIHTDLKKEYPLDENPRTLGVSLKELHNICTRLKFYEKEPTNAEKIHKALSTMHPADRLIYSLTRAERNDELLLKNHHLRPVSSAPLLEVHNHDGPPSRNSHNSSGGRRKNRNFIKNRRHNANKRARKNAPPTCDNGRLCHKCGCNTHFAATCHTPKHLVDLYLKSIRDAKQKENKYEAHFNQATEETGGSSSVPKESPYNKTSSQAMDLHPTDNVLIEYNSNDMFEDLSQIFMILNPSKEELCLVDGCTANSILTEIKYFQTFTKREGNILTIAGRDALTVGSGRAIITLPMGTQIVIEDALLYPYSTRTLLSYRDIRKNGRHVETYEQNKEEFLLLTRLTGYGKQICEKIPTLDFGLYYIYIKPTKHVTYKVIFQNIDSFQT